jgi:hypothetical protein
MSAMRGTAAMTLEQLAVFLGTVLLVSVVATEILCYCVVASARR